MEKIKASSLITTLLVLSLGGVILFYPKLGLNSQVQIKLMSDGINSILRALSVKSRFSQGDVIDGLIFTEYTVFGLLLMIMLKSYTQNIMKNMTIPLFIGLSFAVVSGYISKFFGFGVATIDVVIREFVGLLLGIFIYLVINKVLEDKFGKGNCSRRR